MHYLGHNLTSTKTLFSVRWSQLAYLQDAVNRPEYLAKVLQAKVNNKTKPNAAIPVLFVSSMTVMEPLVEADGQS